MWKVPEQNRITAEVGAKLLRQYNLNPQLVKMWVSTKEVGPKGFFYVPHFIEKKINFLCLASNGEGWEHVSVSIPSKSRCPTWEEMCYIKSLFWDEDDVVVQFHPAKRDYVNNHEFCLHLWKPIGYNIETPPSNLVGIKK